MTPEERPAEEAPTENLAPFYLRQLTLAGKEAKEWEDRCKKIIKIYKREEKVRFNILWSNVETLKPALYSRVPKPVVERRWKTADPIGRLAAQVLERAVDYSIQCSDFDHYMRMVRDDYLLCGRGTLWVRYKPKFGDDGVSIVGQDVHPDYVHWLDFRHSAARYWQEVTWVARRHYLTRKELVEKLGVDPEQAQNVPVKYQPKGLDNERGDKSDKESKAVVWEVWDKNRREVIFVAEDYGDAVLKQQPVGINLKDFFPCPRPLFATLTTDSLTPVPDYALYSDLAEEVETCTRKISALVKALHLSGVYNAQESALANILSANSENKLYPVKDYVGFASRGGLEGAMQLMPLKDIASALLALYDARDKAIEALYQVSGLSDIIRGLSDPNETATAQQIKGQFATLRLSDRQQEVQRFARDTIAIMAEIVSEHFEPDPLAGIVGDDLAQDPNFPVAVELLRNDVLRTYRIDIETDSTIAVDENLDKEQANEFITALGQTVQNFAAAAQIVPAFESLAAPIIMHSVRRYRGGRQLEGQIEEAFDQMEMQRQQEAQQPPQPDPAQMELEARTQIEAAKLDLKRQETEAKINLEAQKTQAQIQIQLEKLNRDYEAKMAQIQASLAELQSTLALKARESEQKIAMEAAKLSNTSENEFMKRTIEAVKANNDAAGKVMQAQQKAERPPAE